MNLKSNKVPSFEKNLLNSIFPSFNKLKLDLNHDSSLNHNLSKMLPAHFNFVGKLTLQSCVIDQTSIEIFDNIGWIEEMELLHCKFSTQEITARIFSKLKRLKHFSVCSSTDFSTLPENMFDMNNKLEYLDLSYNKIKHLPEKLFLKLINLKKIILIGNEIEELSENVFDMNTELDDLELSYTKLNNCLKISFQN
jgi:Leucine-rich repeat (LRR) protein